MSSTTHPAKRWTFHGHNILFSQNEGNLDWKWFCCRRCWWCFFKALTSPKYTDFASEVMANSHAMDLRFWQAPLLALHIICEVYDFLFYLDFRKRFN